MKSVSLQFVPGKLGRIRLAREKKEDKKKTLTNEYGLKPRWGKEGKKENEQIKDVKEEASEVWRRKIIRPSLKSIF